MTAGEIDPRLKGRIDNEVYYAGVDKARNVVMLAHGGARRRPGSRYKALVGSAGANVRKVRFEFSVTQQYTIVFIGSSALIYKAGVLQSTETTPYSDADIRALTFAQSYDTLLIFHPSYAIRALVRGGSDTSWSVSTWTVNNAPTTAFSGPVSGGGTLTLSAYTGEGVTATASAGTPFASAAVGWGVSYRGGYLRITAKTSDLIVEGDVTVDFPNDGTTPDVADAGDWFLEEPSWSATRGYPRCGAFFQERLVVGGSTELPNRIWSSVTADPNDFETTKAGTENVDSGFSGAAISGDVATIRRIHAGRNLMFLTDSGEFYEPNSDREAVTPDNLTIRRATNRGMDGLIDPWEVDGGLMFIQREGKALREFIYNDVEQNFQANEISLLWSHLISSPVDMAYRRAANTETTDLILIVNSDGTVACLSTLRSQQVNAPSLWLTDGKVLAISEEGGLLYWLVERGGSILLEELDDNLYVDSAVTGGAASSASGLSHLEGETVDVVLDGAQQQQQVVASGAVTFPRAAAVSYQVGLPWPEVLTDRAGPLTFGVRLLTPIPDSPRGPRFGQRIRIVAATVQLYETTVCRVNGNAVPFRALGSMLLDQSIQPYTGRKVVHGLAGWSREIDVTIGEAAPGAWTLLATALEVEVH